MLLRLPVELVNHTPFPSLTFISRNVRGDDFHVVVLRAALTVTKGGGTLRADPEQPPLIMADEFHGDPTSSSMRMESDLAPFKPRCDVHVNADAYAPGGIPARDWTVRVRVGNRQKALRVTGPRHWRKTRFGGRSLSEPEPCTIVPIRYELAYGGIWRDPETNAVADVFPENPVGVGYVPSGRSQKADRIEAPRIESPDAPIREPDRHNVPQGLGPCARSWQPRLRMAGHFDRSWIENRWPRLPVDFDYAHYNSAHPDLILDEYLNGGESIELENLTPSGRLRMTLPGYVPFLLRRYADGVILPAPLALDTLVIDLHENRVYLVWRGQLATLPALRAVEVRMKHPASGGTLDGR